MSKRNPAPCITCGAPIYQDGKGKWRNDHDGALHHSPTNAKTGCPGKTAKPEASTPMRTTDSLPPKAERYTCPRCGLKQPAPIVTATGCTNAGACAKRVKLAKKHDAKTGRTP